MARLFQVVSRLPKPWVQIVALILALMVGYLDYITGYDVHITPFYVLPIAWACWVAGSRAGLNTACFCTFLTWVADLFSGHAYSHPAIAYWNALMMLSLFSIVVFSLTALKAEIAGRERMEKAKLQAERLLERQEKLATLGTLTAGLAHEIRNPLTSLKARLYTLEKRLQDLPAARKDTEIINAEISRLDRIVQEALSFARPAEPRLETIAADTLLRQVQGLMSASLERPEVQLTVESGPGLFIRADSGHLMQVLVNLVRNAVDSIEGAGTVTLRGRSEPTQMGLRAVESVILEVTDTGKGIPPEVEKRLFDPFFTTKAAGTGLGLPVAARLVEKHGGNIEFQTRLGHGTTFRVVIPREFNDPARRETASANIPSGRSPVSR
jgi:signal transduction histidine kinase